MKDLHIYSLNVNGSISGASCRGDFEKRLNETFDFIEKQPNAVLFIEEKLCDLLPSFHKYHLHFVIFFRLKSRETRCIF